MEEINEQKYKEVKSLICDMIDNAIDHFKKPEIINILLYLKTQIEELQIEE
tara:strand:- start:13522 stop:13674 length:153 start_codon:yes stop_codon:yes gene_type:complete